MHQGVVLSARFLKKLSRENQEKLVKHWSIFMLSDKKYKRKLQTRAPHIILTECSGDFYKTS